MEESINKGMISGISDPGDAMDLVRKSLYTYTQTKNIVQGNSIAEVYYDEDHERVVSDYPYGLNVAISYALSIWEGDEAITALKKAAISGIKVNGIDFAAAVMPEFSSEYELEDILNAYGESNHPKPFFTKYEIAEIIKSRIMNGRLQPNKPEEKGLLGKVKGIFSRKNARPRAGAHEWYHYISDEALEFMIKCIVKSYTQLSDDFMLNRDDCDWVLDKLCHMLTGRALRDIYINENRLMIIDEMIRPIIQPIVNGRTAITPPDREQLHQGLTAALGTIANEEMKLLLK
jgi:hypothetical protein